MREQHIAIFSNSAWSIVNFRIPLVRRMLESGYKVTVFTPFDAYVDQIEALGIPVAEVKHLYPKGTNPWQDLRLLFEIRRLIRKHKVDILLSYTVKPNIYGGIASRMSGITHLPTVNGLGYTMYFKGFLHNLLYWLYSSAFRRNTCVVFQNRDDADEFLEKKVIPASAVRIVAGSGVDLEAFGPKDRNNATQELRFLFSGRLIREKGISEFLQAARVIRGRYPGCKFLVLGLPANNPHAVPEEVLKAAREEGYLDFYGTTDSVAEFLDGVDVLVLPSYYREGIPRALLEAMAREIPIITTDFTGCRETVVEGENGFLVPPRDVDALVTAMESLVRMDPEKRIGMGRKGRDLAKKHFSIETVNARYLSMIEQLVKQG